jgi:hypothetical protein
MSSTLFLYFTYSITIYSFERESLDLLKSNVNKHKNFFLKFKFKNSFLYIT